LPARRRTDVSPAQVPFNLKIMFTSLSLLVFLVLSQLPVFGAQASGSFDPLASARGALGATAGTLGALGVLPLLTAGFALQMLASARIVDVNFGLKEDRALFGTAQKRTSSAPCGLTPAPRVRTAYSHPHLPPQSSRSSSP
jgi:preprotein translocase subunit SecY